MPDAPAPAIGALGRHAAAMRATVERARREIPFYAEHHRNTPLPSTCMRCRPAASRTSAPSAACPCPRVPCRTLYRVSATSGTTGERLFIGHTEGEWRAVREQYARVVRCIGIESTDVLLNTHGGGLWIGAPSLDELAHAGGAGIVPCGPTGPAQVIEWLRDLPVTLISATPLLHAPADRDGGPGGRGPREPAAPDGAPRRRGFEPRPQARRRARVRARLPLAGNVRIDRDGRTDPRVRPAAGTRSGAA